MYIYYVYIHTHVMFYSFDYMFQDISGFTCKGNGSLTMYLFENYCEKLNYFAMNLQLCFNTTEDLIYYLR